MAGIIRTAALFLWAPASAGALASVVTWLVWFYTALPCTEETALTLLCQPTPLARYVSSTVLNHCFIHSGVAMTIMGGSDLMLFIRERRRTQEERQRADRMMDLMKETIDQLAEERRQAYEQIKQATEQAAVERRLLEERVAEERRYAAEQLAEERRQNAADRQAFLDTLTKLTEVIGQNGRGHG